MITQGLLASVEKTRTSVIILLAVVQAGVLRELGPG